jgi:cleavage and polyadenylation specificity factor subunit 1
LASHPVLTLFHTSDPKSLHGQLLLHRTTFSLGGYLPTTLTLLPRTQPTAILPATQNGIEAAAQSTIPDYEILITTTTGAICLLSPLSEQEYRRLGTLATQLSNTLYHPCGLNPKAYRVASNAPEAVLGGRPIVDGALLMRWGELGSQRRAEIASRMGVSPEAVRDDLEGLQGGLEYL